MKITLCQLNYIVGDIEGNAQKIIEHIEQAKSENSDLVVFSELAICGYPPYDLLFNSSFVQKSIDAIEAIAQHCQNITAIVGGIETNHGDGKNLFNAAFVLQNGKIAYTYHKALLPTYDVFDEARYFEPAYKPLFFNLKNKNIAITICEDLWTTETDTQPSPGKPKYQYNILQTNKALNVDLMVNIAASPYSIFQHSYRYDVLTRAHHFLECPIIYVNQVGAHTDLIFDGGSVIFNNLGDKHFLPFFEESHQTINLDTLTQQGNCLNPIESLYYALKLGIRDYFAKNNFKKAVLGLSGGIDSAVVAVLAAHALGNENVHCLLMPSRFSSQHSVDDAIDLCKRNHISFDILSIEKPFIAFEESLHFLFQHLPNDVTEENIQARIRAIYLMAYSNKFGNILLNTSNKSEIAVGYGTLYGDMCGALAIIGDVYKTQVYELAKFINKKKELIPINIINKAPSAELRPNQKDSDSLPEYEHLDKLLYHIIEMQLTIPDLIKQGFSENLAKKIYRLVQINEYKRYQGAPVLRVSSKAFGYGRRIPLVKKF
ncbi:MAG: NAD+ synthase [Bacteroidales bacterium]|nr:NAD+ synthase [Bacteroidales bacterium]